MLSILSSYGASFGILDDLRETTVSLSPTNLPSHKSKKNLL